jgi:hypothetical protein
MISRDLESARELDSRSFDGIVVRLLWRESDGWVGVSVDDAKTGDAFVVDVVEGDSALDVFHHPFAYAARRGIVLQRRPDPT